MISKITISKLQIGFTVIELLVIIGIIALLGSVGMVVGFDTVYRQAVNNERDLLTTLLYSSRAWALANISQSSHGLLVENDSIILFTGDSYALSDPASHKVINRNPAITISGDTEIVFKPLSGNVELNKTITVAGGSQSATVDINSQGRIEW